MIKFISFLCWGVLLLVTIIAGIVSPFSFVYWIWMHDIINALSALFLSIFCLAISSVSILSIKINGRYVLEYVFIRSGNE